MQLTIYDKNGNAKVSLSPNDSSTQQKEIQGDNILTLSFTHWRYISLDVNDYTDFEGERYWLQERYTPKEENEGKWTYDLKMYGLESLIKRFLVLETTDGNAEPVFTLTAPPAEHVKMIVKCLNDGMGNITDWKVGKVVGTDNIVIDYEGKYCDEALKEIAEKVGGDAEWWIDGTTVNICRCEQGEPLVIGYGNGLTSLERDTGNTAKFYTRLFPIGSTRNIDPEKYGHPRLMLPGGQKYVEVKTEEYGIYDHYEQDSFSAIYPRRTGTVNSVRHETRKDDDGNDFDVYYFKDSGLDFDPNKYELAGEVKRVSFQDGELAGLGDSEDHYFEVNYDSDTKEFEIITIWPYDDDTQLPGGSLVPKIGDHYILWNIRMPDEYYALAEQELKEAVDKYNDEHWKDISIYKGQTDHVWVEQQEAELYAGRRIRLESAKYFPATGYRPSRITKLTRKVTLPGQVDLEISDAIQTGTMQQMTDSIGEVKNYTKERTSATLPDVVRSWDNTPLTDNNLLSARRSMQEFLSKKRPDRAKKRIIFDEGIGLGDFSAGEEGGNIDGNGNAELATLVVRQLLRSVKFEDGLDGEGWRLWMDKDSLSHLTLDKLTVRQSMTVLELLIQKVRSVGGMICVSAADGKVKAVEDDGDFWRITFEEANTFLPHDLMRCQTFTGAALKSYWVEIAETGSDWVKVAKSEFTGSQPEAGDECVLMGNTTEKNRQNMVVISATEDGQPRVDVMDGVSGKTFANALRARLGNLDGINDDAFPTDRQPQGNGLYSDNAYLRGTFLLSTGEDVKTRFEIMEGKVESEMAGIRDDFTGNSGYLSNAAFADGMDKWNTQNEAVFFLVGNKWIWANGKVLTKKGSCASVTKDQGRTVVLIRNKYISQRNENLLNRPTFKTNADGKKEPVAVYLSFFYRCKTAGTLKVEFQNVDKTGFENFNSMSVEETIEATEGYKQYTCNGLWNGTGDFKLSFTGEIYLYMLILSTDKVESLTYKYRTLFEQSDKLINIAAQNFDKDGKVLAESEIITTSEWNELVSARFNEDGSLKNTAGLVTTTNFTNWQSTTYTTDISGLRELLNKKMDVEAFSGMFATAVSNDTNIVKQADIAVFVTKDKDGNLESGVHVGAEQITMEGLVTANENFKILKDGSMEAQNGKFKGSIEAVTGTIGGFIIGSNHIGVGVATRDSDGKTTIKEDNNGLFLYDSMIGFNGQNRQAIFGTWNNLGQPMLVRLTDTYADTTTSDGKKYSILPKYGIVFDIRNSASGNFAFLGNGNGVLNGMVDGYKFTKVSVKEANTIYQTSMMESNRLLVNCSADGSGISLPRLSVVRSALGIGNSTPFSVRLMIMADLGTNSFSVYGRNNIEDSKKVKSWSSDDYPLLTHWNGGRWDTVAMGTGDAIEVMLVYDPSRTDKIDDFTTKYTARIINRQD